MLARLRRIGRDESGIELIEFIGFFPLVMIVIVAAWQFIMVGYTGVVAAQAAREGARAAVVRQDVGRAVTMASPGFDGRRDYTVSGGCGDYAGNAVVVQVRLEVPHVALPFIGALRAPKVGTTAALRCEPPFQSP